jgi:hypothetical protein
MLTGVPSSDIKSTSHAQLRSELGYDVQKLAATGFEITIPTFKGGYCSLDRLGQTVKSFGKNTYKLFL